MARNDLPPFILFMYPTSCGAPVIVLMWPSRWFVCSFHATLSPWSKQSLPLTVSIYLLPFSSSPTPAPSSTICNRWNYSFCLMRIIFICLLLQNVYISWSTCIFKCNNVLLKDLIPSYFSLNTVYLSSVSLALTLCDPLYLIGVYNPWCVHSPSTGRLACLDEPAITCRHVCMGVHKRTHTGTRTHSHPCKFTHAHIQTLSHARSQIYTHLTCTHDAMTMLLNDSSWTCKNFFVHGPGVQPLS